MTRYTVDLTGIPDALGGDLVIDVILQDPDATTDDAETEATQAVLIGAHLAGIDIDPDTVTASAARAPA